MSLSALLFNRLGSSACFHGTAENVDHILEFGDKKNLDYLQEGLIPNTETLSISNLPFAVRWIAESSNAIGLPTSQTRTHLRTTFGQNKTYQPNLARTKDILAETLDRKTEAKTGRLNTTSLTKLDSNYFTSCNC